MLHPIFYTLTLSRRVEALTCPRCIATDHLKSDCALASLKPASKQPGNRAMDTRQPGPPRKRFRREGMPTSKGSGSSSGRVAYCFSFNEGQCFCHAKLCKREHKCIHCGKEHQLTVRQHSLLPQRVTHHLHPKQRAPIRTVVW